MSDPRLARLVHNVGKYVARVARNVPPQGPFPDVLLPLLLKDLYETSDGRRMSEVFAEHAGPLGPHRLLDVAEATLCEIDELEGRVRGGDKEACLQACAKAREVDDALRRFARGVAR